MNVYKILPILYRRSGFNCEYLLIANCEFFYVSQIRKHKRARILRYGTGSSIAINGFAIWPDLTRTQLLNYAIKTRPTVIQISYMNQNPNFSLVCPPPIKESRLYIFWESNMHFGTLCMRMNYYNTRYYKFNEDSFIVESVHHYLLEMGLGI